MATIYVDSAATGLNNGTSWTDAYTGIQSALTAGTPGTDEVWVDDGHNEQISADVVCPANNIKRLPVLSVDKLDDSRSPGAKITTAANVDIVMYGSAFWDGISFESGDDMAIGTYTIEEINMLFNECTFKDGPYAGNDIGLGNWDFAVPAYLHFKKCTFEFGHLSGGFEWVNCGGEHTFEDCTFTGPSGGALTTLVHAVQADGANALFVGCDLSQVTNICVPDANLGTIKLYSCKMKSGFAPFTSAPSAVVNRIEMINCQSGTDSDPAWLTTVEDPYGTLDGDSARYRTGGPSDGKRTNPTSWNINTTANVQEIYTPFRTIPIFGWTPGNGSTAYNYDIFFASGGTMQDDEIWVEFFFPHSLNTSSQWERVSTRLAPRGTPSNVASDGSSTWNGTDVGTKQYLRAIHTPDKPGPVMAIVYVAKPSERVSVEPMIHIAAA